MAEAFTTQRPPVRGATHMVSAGHYLASAAGYRMLEDGGNAIDAGVAAGIVLGVTLPHYVSFGGVAPIMVYMAETDEVITISGLGRWPKAATLDLLLERSNGGIPSSILRTVTPAAPDAWMTALSNYGTMSLEQVIAPAIEICENGFVVQGVLTHFLPQMKERIESSPGLREIFMPDGQLVEEGDVLVQKNLGRTFRRLIDVERAHSQEGRTQAITAARDYFYKGDIAKEITDFIQSNGGLLTYEDMANFSVKIEAPEKGQYRDYEVYTCGPWCQGPAFIEVLNILEGYDLREMGHNSTNYVHAIAESIKLAFSDRHYYFGDPEFIPVPLKGLLSKEYADERRSSLNMEVASPEMPLPGDPFKYQNGGSPEFKLARKPQAKSGRAPHDTSYVCAVDRWGNGFSATPSDGYTNFVPDLGLPISSRGTQSWLQADHPSVVAPMKRPRLTPNPAMAFKDGKLFMTFGTPGADVQIQAMTQVFLNVVEFGMNAQQAVEMPRFASYSFPLTGMSGTYEPGVLRCESGIGESVLNGLSGRGHAVEDWGQRNYLAGCLCAITVDHERGTLTAGADYRREAYAIGR